MSESVFVPSTFQTIPDGRTHASITQPQRNTDQHTARILEGLHQRETNDHCKRSDCRPILLRLHVYEQMEVHQHLGSVCSMEKNTFLEEISSFAHRYDGSIGPNPDGYMVHYGQNGSRSAGQGGREYQYLDIIYPGDDECRGRDRMVLSHIYKSLVERGCGADGPEIRLTVLKRS